MANALPIIEAIYTSGSTLYAILRDRMTGKVWNTSGTPAFEVYNAAHWASYAIAMTEQASSGYYTSTRPAGVAGFLTSEQVFNQAGGGPATSDAPSILLGYSAGQNVGAIAGDASAAPTNLQAGLSTEVQSSVAAGTITNQTFPTNLTNTNANAYSGRVLYFTSGACAGMAGLIATYVVASGVITLSGALAATPSAADTFIIV